MSTLRSLACQLTLVLLACSARGQEQIPDRHLVKPGGAKARSLEEVRIEVERLKPQVIAAYNLARRGYPNSAGTAVVRFTIMPTGSVTEPRIIASNISGPMADEIGARLIAVLRTASFAPEDVSVMEVTYPFSFKPD